MHAPDRVYIQNPYDEANPCLTVPPYFYASNVRKYADEVVYVPIAPTSEFSENDGCDMYNLSHYVTAPGVICADKVIVQSDNIKRLYVDALTSFAGKDTADVWEDKIVVAELENEKNATCIGKKKLLVCIGANELVESKGRSVPLTEALNKKFKVLEDAADKIDVSIVFYPEDKDLWLEVDGNLAKEVFEIIANTNINVISSRPQDADTIARDYDAYYGSPSPFVPAFSIAGKPVMIADFGLE